MQSGKILKAGFNIRPYIKQLLTDVNKYYEVVVFTASHKWYADVILDHIDPKGVFFQHRLYRESCIKTTDNVYVKDLRVINNVDARDMLLVDNAVYSFGLQLGNGIPITPFKEEKDDKEFLFLKRFLFDIRNYEDLRDPINAAFSLDKLIQEGKYSFDDFIDYYDYEECEMEQDADDEHELQVNEKSQVAGPPSQIPPKSANANPVLAKSVEDNLDGIGEILGRQKFNVLKMFKKTI